MTKCNVIICRTIYVAEFGSDNVIGYQRKPNNDLVQIWVTFYTPDYYLLSSALNHGYFIFHIIISTNIHHKLLRPKKYLCFG